MRRYGDEEQPQAVTEEIEEGREETARPVRPGGPLYRSKFRTLGARLKPDARPSRAPGQAAAGSTSAALSGMLNENVAPQPGSLSTQIRPPCAVTSCRAM